MTAMTKYLAGVLTAIAVGITVIAFNLVFPHATLDAREAMLNAAEPVAPYATPVTDTRALAPAAPFYGSFANQAMNAQMPHAVRTVETEPVPQRVVTRAAVEHAPRRDWKKAAMVIGGSTAAGAGIGGIIGGKKGALIGAALGGGASTIYQTTR